MAPRLLILRALKLGDLLTSVPALRALARAFPSHERVLAAPGWLEPLTRLIDAEGGQAIDRVAPMGELEPLPPDFYGCEFAVNLHGRGPQSHHVLLGARPQRILWFENAQVKASAGAPRWRSGEHEVVRWCRLLAAYGITADPADIHLPLRPWGGPAPDTTLIHPGASSPARQWPVERFAAVARAERRCGHKVLITGTGGERELASRLPDAAELPGGSVLAGRTSLLGLAHKVASAGRVVCGDTGVAHLAVALATPSVTVFGPTSPAHWGPLKRDGVHRVLWSGRQGDPHGSKPDPGLLEIRPEQVISALQALP